MPKGREFGISGVLLTLVIVPLVTLVILHKWKKGRAARRTEIRKLLILAAEEAARVEAEAAAEYASSTAVSRYQCALCFGPASTRCSRCKAVRYCSGKCQIIHWRQGHKQECQPPDIDNSSASVLRVPSQRSEPDSTSLAETQELRAYEPNLQEPINCTPSIQKLHDYTSEIPELFAPEVPQDSTSKISPEVTTEIYDHEGVNVIDSVSVASNTFCNASDSSVKSLSECVALSKDAPISDSPACESSLSDISHSCGVYLSNSASLDAFSSKDVITDIPKFETPMSGIPFTNYVNNISCANVSTPNSPILKNQTIGLPVSGISSDSFPVSSSSEHGLCSPTSLIEDLPTSRCQVVDLPSTANKPLISEDLIHNVLSSKSPVHQSSSTNGHVAGASGPLHRCSSSVGHVVDVPMHKNSGKNTLNAGISLPTSSSTKSSVSNVSSCEGYLQNANGCLNSTCSGLQNPVSNELDTKMPGPKIDSPRTSVSNGTSRRSVRTAFQHSSSHRERASVCTISHQKTGNCDTVSSSAFQTAGSSLYTGNGFKASVKKVAQQLKSSKASKQNAMRTINDSIGKSSKLLFPYECFVKLFNWDKLELPPCGLINCGNSCYANAVLQCLTFTRPIAAYLLQGYHSNICQRKDWCFMCELEHLVSRVREGKSPLSPIRIMSQIQNIGNHLGYGREEDAHEFLRFAIDTMQSICLDEAGGEKAVEARAQETTFIQQIFGGYLQSKIKCLKCQHTSERYENMMDLTVEIEGNIESLQDALAQFTAPEILDGENKYKCDRCKSYVKARKQLTVHEAPNILTIALKRFQTGKFGKLNKRVIFPEALNLKPYMSGTGDKPPLYKLYAVVVHLDMMNASFSGHYVCYVKNLQGAWYKIDDSKVKQVELDRVMLQGAYMLLYSRSSPRPPAMIRNGMADTFTHTSTTVRMDPCTRGVKKSLLNNGYERFGVLDTRWSPVPCTVNAEEYADLTSSDSGSLFSCSDEASCSTESNRDSTSTDDYSETVFGDLGPLTCNSSGLSEDSYGSSNLVFCMKPSSGSLQTEYCFENDPHCMDSAFSNQQLCDNVCYGKGNIDQKLSPELNLPPLDITGLPSWLSNSASSYFFHPSVQSNHTETNSDSDVCSKRNDWLDYRISNVSEDYNLLQSQNLFEAPEVSDSGACSRSEDFADPAKSQYIKEKYMSGILKGSERLNFDVPSRSFNAATNFDYSLVLDNRTDIRMVQFFGLE